MTSLTVNGVGANATSNGLANPHSSCSSRAAAVMVGSPSSILPPGSAQMSTSGGRARVTMAMRAVRAHTHTIATAPRGTAGAIGKRSGARAISASEITRIDTRFTRELAKSPTLPQPLVASPYASRNEITVSQNPRIGTPIFSASTTSSLIETSPTSSGRTMTGSVW